VVIGNDEMGGSHLLLAMGYGEGKSRCSRFAFRLSCGL